MDVSSNNAFRSFVQSETTNGNLFADLSNASGYQSFNGLAVQLGSQQSFNVSWFGSYDMSSNFFNEFFEAVGFSNKVGFAVNFYDCTDLAVSAYERANNAFSSNAAGFFSSSSQTFFTQEVDCFVHIAFYSGQCFFAVHHASASTLAQFFN